MLLTNPEIFFVWEVGLGNGHFEGFSPFLRFLAICGNLSMSKIAKKPLNISCEHYQKCEATKFK